jgi:hypothetical protein
MRRINGKKRKRKRLLAGIPFFAIQDLLPRKKNREVGGRRKVGSWGVRRGRWGERRGGWVVEE